MRSEGTRRSESVARGRGRTLRLLVIALAAVALLAWNGNGCVKAQSVVIWVHGYDGPGGQSGIDLESQFRVAVEHFREQGWSQPMYVVSYYDGDVSWNDAALDVTTLHLNGGGGACPHEEHHASGHSGDAGCFGTTAHTRDTEIEHLGYHLAWEIHDRFTADDVEVRVIAHSMGGLITRYALQQVAAGHADFPDRLDVGAVATMGTPHAGGDLAFLCIAGACGKQGDQMEPGSDFLTALGGTLPAGDDIGNPYWWLYAAQDDDSVNVGSALDPSGGYDIEYEAGQAIEHGDYLKRDSTAKIFECFFRDSGPITSCAGPLYSAQRRLSEQQCTDDSECGGGQTCSSGVCQLPTDAVVHLNIANGCLGCPEEERKGQEAIREILEAGQRPLAITLNEVCHHRFEEIEDIAAPRGYSARFFPTEACACGNDDCSDPDHLGYGNAVFVRGSIFYETRSTDLVCPGQAPDDFRGVACVNFDASVAGTGWALACVTHLSTDPDVANCQAEEALSFVQGVWVEAEHPWTAVGADLNLEPDEPGVAAWKASPIFRMASTDDLPTHGSGRTIDYVFSSVDAETGPVVSTDHSDHDLVYSRLHRTGFAETHLPGE